MDMNEYTPTSTEVKEMRNGVGLTQKEAACSVYCTKGAWERWEMGTRTMPAALWELFLLKAKLNILESYKK